MVIERYPRQSSLYLDGGQVSCCNSQDMSTYIVNTISIGYDDYDGGRNYFDGQITDFTTWDLALTPIQVNDHVLGDSIGESNLIDIPAMMAGSIADSLSQNEVPSQIVSSKRLQYYLDTEVNMYSPGVSYIHSEINVYPIFGETFPPPLPEPVLSPSMFSDINEGRGVAKQYLQSHPADTCVNWYYYEVVNEYPLTVYWYHYQTTRSFDFSAAGKTIWHPFGTVFMATDVLPSSLTENKTSPFLHKLSTFLSIIVSELV